MAEYKVESSQVVAPDLFKDTRESAKLTIESLTKLREGLEQILQANAEVLKLNSKVNGASSKELARINQLLDSSQKDRLALLEVQKQEAKAKIEDSKLTQQLIREKKEEIRLTDAQRKQTDRLKKANDGLNSAYKQGVKTLSLIKKQMKELVFEGKENTREFKELSKQYDVLNKKVRNAEERVGENFRNVGNYKSGFDGLGNSINQLSREMPAFAVSMQTGFLALSNNIPIFFDEIKRVNNEIKNLQNQGKKTPTLFQKISSSIFSWGSALSVGVTLLTIFGSEIVKVISNMIQMDNAFVESEDSLKSHTSFLKGVIKEYKSALLQNKVLKGEITEQQKNIIESEQSTAEKIAEANENLRARKADILENGLDDVIEINKEIEILGEKTVVKQLALEDKRLKQRNKATKKLIESLTDEDEIQRVLDANEIYNIRALENYINENKLKFDEIEKINKTHIDTITLLTRKGQIDQENIYIDSEKKRIKNFNKYSKAYIKAVEALNKDVSLLSEDNPFERIKIDIENEEKALDQLYDADKKILQAIIDSDKSTKAQKEKASQDLIVLEEKKQQALLDLNIKYNLKRDQELENAVDRARKITEEGAKQELTLLESQLLNLETEKLKGLDVDEKIAQKRIEISFFALQKVLADSRSTYAEIEKAIAIHEKNKAQIENDGQKERAEARKRELQDNIKVFQDLTKAIKIEIDARNNAEIRSLDYQLRQREDNIKEQQAQAERGAENQLVFEKQKRDQLELQRREAEEKAARQREALILAESFLNSFNARMARQGRDGKPVNSAEATVKALGDVLLARAVSKTVVQFAKDGNDMVTPVNGQGGKIGVDDIPFMLTKGEGVVTREGNLSNDGVVSSLNNGTFKEKYMPRFEFDDKKAFSRMRKPVQNDLTIKQNEEIKKILLDIKNKPVHRSWVDGAGNIIEEAYKSGFKQTTKHINRRPRI